MLAAPSRAPPKPDCRASRPPRQTGDDVSLALAMCHLLLGNAAAALKLLEEDEVKQQQAVAAARRHKKGRGGSGGAAEAAGGWAGLQRTVGRACACV